MPAGQVATGSAEITGRCHIISSSLGYHEAWNQLARPVKRYTDFGLRSAAVVWTWRTASCGKSKNHWERQMGARQHTGIC